MEQLQMNINLVDLMKLYPEFNPDDMATAPISDGQYILRLFIRFISTYVSPQQKCIDSDGFVHRFVELRVIKGCPRMALFTRRARKNKAIDRQEDTFIAEYPLLMESAEYEHIKRKPSNPLKSKLNYGDLVNVY